nr:neuronal acetylcholine receptor subunit beta-3-like isoform X2 [Rhipicephalus microplus]
MLRKVCIAYVILCSLQTFVKSAGSDLNRVAHHENLLKHLFDPERYSKEVRPVFYHTNVTEVTLDMLIKEIAEMDHSRQTVKVNMVMSAKWKDEFLSWKPSDYGGEDIIVIPAEKIWVPQVVSVESISPLLTSQSSGSGHSRLMARVNSSGHVSLDHVKQLPARCVATPEGFRSSRHECAMTLNTLDFGGHHVRLHGDVQVDVEHNPAWEVSQTRITNLYHSTLVVFVSLSATLSVASLACAIAAHKLLHSADRCEVPRGLVNFLEAPFWQFLCVGGFQPASSAAARETEMEHLSHDPPMAAEMAEAPAPVSTNQEPRLREEWQAVSRALDRALFVAFVVMFISFRLVFAGHNWGGKSRTN